jgi:mono/diheme cytochrome c family protein
LADEEASLKNLGRKASLPVLAALAATAVLGVVFAQVAGAHTAGTPLIGSVAAGKTLFKAQGCGKCHTLAAAKSTGTIGPNLNKIKPSQALVAKQVTTGGGFMPSFGGTLKKAQIDDIAAYVYSSTH